jgi:diguanylate cyclase (GGDEF)-like protein
MSPASAPSEPVQVLLVEDSEDDAMLLAHQLQRHDEPIAITRVDTPFALQEALDAKAWDIVLSDYRMPSMSGLVALEVVRRHSRELPFILVSATVGEDVAVDAMRSGASDYVMKNQLARLLPAFQRELRAARSRHESISERDAQRKRIDHLAHYDATTGLANRTLFDERLAAFVEGACEARCSLAVLVVHLDRLATIAGVVGRQAADELVVQASSRLASRSHEAAGIARIDTDRIAIVLSRVDEKRDAVRTLLQEIRASFDAPFVLSGSEFRLDPAVGVAIYPDDGAIAPLILRNAEAAAAEALAYGHEHLFYSEQMTARVAEKLTMENRLRRALERGEFVLYYQPKFDIREGKVSGVEALIRWISPELGLVYPAEFIPLLEETGLILEVGAWALRKAVSDHRLWSERGPIAPRIAVNVSVSQLQDPRFVEIVSEAIAGSMLAAAIDLEITESLLMEDVAQSIAKLSTIRDLGVGIAIDDFGTGYSSLAYLAKLPVIAVKIDRVFTATMLEDPATMRLVATMIDLAHSLRLKAIAEGVESPEQAAALRTLGCDEMQGYLVGRPMPWEQMAALLAGDAPPRWLLPTENARRDFRRILGDAGSLYSSLLGGVACEMEPSAADAASRESPAFTALTYESSRSLFIAD